MPLSTHTEQRISAFCEQLAPFESAYEGQATLGFCALRLDDKWHLYSARLRLGHEKALPKVAFATVSVMAGRFAFNMGARTMRQVINEFLGRIRVPDGLVEFEGQDKDQGNYDAYVVPHHRSPGERSALATLNLRGGRNWQTLDQEEIGWRLRGSEIAFESLAELCAECDAGTDPGSLEIVAAPVVRVNPTSSVVKTKAVLVVSCPGSLELNHCRLSYRVIHGSTVADRGSAKKPQLVWAPNGDNYIGTVELTVAEGALIDCAVSYRGETQHQAWVTDRTAVQNPRRAAFEPSDTDLLNMQSLLCGDDGKHGRGFEAAVAWLFWMLGFSPTHLCNSKHHEDAPDILVECGGGFAVVECSIGQLKADKRSNLQARCIAIKESLAAAGSRETVVLPVLVTRFNEEQASTDLEDAAKAGQHVLTSGDLLSLLERTRQINSPESIFAEWRNSVESQRSASERSRQAAY